MSASACVSGRNFATQVRKFGSASIGKSAPARNQGKIAIAGTRAMYSSCLGTRLARISAIPYMPTVKRAAAVVNQTIPIAVASNWIPLAIETASSTPGGRGIRTRLYHARTQGSS